MTHVATRVRRIGRIVGLASALGMALTLGLGGPAWADQGSGDGQSAAHSTPSSTSASTAHNTTPDSSTAKSNSGGSDSKSNSGGSAVNSSGSTTSPQPISTADANSGGANGQCPGGPYCSTRDGSPSLNGNGNGKAEGKPCAGCVGKADNKNPKGQMPNGSDSNAGYECDRNHGIGRSNPAHTGCTLAPLPPVGCVATSESPCTTPPGGCVATSESPCTTPPGGCVTTGASVACGHTTFGVLGVSATRQLPAGAPRTSAAALATTGSNISWLLETGLLLVGLGSVALFVTRWAGRRASD